MVDVDTLSDFEACRASVMFVVVCLHQLVGMYRRYFIFPKSAKHYLQL